MIKILVAVDGSPSSLDAVRYCIGLARHGLEVGMVVANVQEEASFLQLALQDPDAIARAAVQAGEHLMSAAVLELQAAGVPLVREVALGEPATALIDIAERFECHSIVIGARGMGALQRAFVGSVSQSVLQHSPIPVTLVHAPQSASSD